MKQKFFWGVFIRFMLEEYLMLSIANTIKLYDLRTDNFRNGVSSLMAIVSIILLVALPLITRNFLYNKWKEGEITKPEFIQKWGELYRDINTRER